jgi:N4-gp56 family major capsid protein
MQYNGKNEKDLKFEDFTVDETDVTNSGISALITKDITADMEPQLVAQQFLAEDTKLVNGTGLTRRFRFRNAATDAQTFNAGAAVPGVTTPVTYSYVDATPTKFGHSEEVLEDAIDDFDVDIIKDTEEALADGMARKSNSRIILELLGATTATNEVMTIGNSVATRFNLDHGQVISITTLTVNGVAKVLGTDFWCDFYRGVIEFFTPPAVFTPICTYLYSANSNAVEAENVKSFSRNDIVNASIQIQGSCYGKADLCMVHQNQMGNIIKDEQFTDASKYGGNGPLMTGEVGKTANVNLITTETMYEGLAFVAQKGKRLGYLVYKKKVIAKAVEEETKSGDILLKTWEKSIPKVCKNKFGCIVFNCHRYAKAIKSGGI